MPPKALRYKFKMIWSGLQETTMRKQFVQGFSSSTKGISIYVTWVFVVAKFLFQIIPLLYPTKPRDMLIKNSTITSRYFNLVQLNSCEILNDPTQTSIHRTHGLIKNTQQKHAMI
jgi:cytochrome c biogenesis factor